MRPLLVALLAFNAATFLLFGWDKIAARSGRRRVPESWLLLASALGGCIGAWIAVSVFRHKTKKVSFRVKMVLATAVNAVWVWGYLRMRG